MDLGDLIAGLDVQSVTGPGRRGLDAAQRAVRICDLTEDSRTVVPGSLFIARKGLKDDGGRFAREAAEGGAVAILTDDPGLTLPEGFDLPVVYGADVPGVSAAIAERFYGSPSRSVRLIGVTGTNGKTTTTYLAWQILNAANRRSGLIGTVVVDDGIEVGPAAMTTPPAIELSRSLAMMVEGGCEAAALEVSSHALEQKRADALRFRVGIFTNLSGDHLDYHGTMEAYATAKAKLFQGLAPDALAIVNAHDKASVRMVRECNAPVLMCDIADASGLATTERFGREVGGRANVEIGEATMRAMHLRLVGPWGEIQAMVPLVGRYNAMNVLQAASACHFLGVSREEIEKALPELKAPPGRLERVTTPDALFDVFVDYAHSDDSLRNVLATIGMLIPGRLHAGGSVSEIAGAPAQRPGAGRLWAVFGCGGDRDRTKRPRMGKAADEYADMLVVTSDNPRTEMPGAIIDEILAGIPKSDRSNVTVQADRARAIQHAIAHAAPGDAIVIAGKGHETEQILPDGRGGTIRTHFDDREVARAALEHRYSISPVTSTPIDEPKAAHKEMRGAAPRRHARKTG